jgi:hypothetical protein
LLLTFFFRLSVDLELSKRLASIDAGQAGTEVLLRGSLRYRDAWKLWHVRDFVLTLDRLAYFKGSEKDESEGHMQLNGCSVDVRRVEEGGAAASSSRTRARRRTRARA